MIERHAVDRMIVTSHQFEVPLDWTNRTDARRIRIAAKEVVAAERQEETLPVICWFQGGPGFGSTPAESRSGWLAELLKRYRVVLMDERGTGGSTPLDTAYLPYPDGPLLAEYLEHFRADSIVEDAEYIRRELLGVDGRWSICGQSFGGFCCLTYLSFHPDHLDGAIVLAGFAPILHSADEVYRSLLEGVAERNRSYYQLFPDDIDRVRQVIDHLRDETIDDGQGGHLSPRRFLVLGELFGHARGYARLHTVVERCASDLKLLGGLSRWSRDTFVDVLRLRTHPIYAVLHEPLYAQWGATCWAAQGAVSLDARFALEAQPTPYFTGEMIFPWMFDEMEALRPLHHTAQILAEKQDWPLLYDGEALRLNHVPVVGTIFHDDLYVERAFACETARLVRNCRVWISNEYAHRAYADDPSAIFTRLFVMLDETIQPR